LESRRSARRLFRVYRAQMIEFTETSFLQNPYPTLNAVREATPVRLPAFVIHGYEAVQLSA